MPEPGTLTRWLLGAESAPPPAAARHFAGTGLAALAAVERAAGARCVVSPALAGRRELADAAPGGLGLALGFAMGGERTALFATGAELAGESGLLAHAVAQRVPLVVHLVGPERALAALTAAGAVVLMPRSAAEAADLALVARRFAERHLALAVQALDERALATALGDAALLDDVALGRLLGRPGDAVPAEGAAARTLFGETRRRVPRWLAAERPLRLGARPGAQGAAAAFAGAEILFDADLAGALDAAGAAVARVTGRALPALAGARLGRAELGLIACGPAAETAAAVAAQLRHEGVPTAVLSLQRLTPLPVRALVEAIAGCRRVAILERCPVPGVRGPLYVAVESALGAAGVTAALAALAVPGPEAPLTAADLAAGCRGLADRFRPRLLLGLAPAGGDGRDPKRRAFADALRREDPELDARGAQGEQPLHLLPRGAATIAVCGPADGIDLAADAGAFLHRLGGGHLRARAVAAPALAGEPARAWVSWSPQPIPDPGDEPPAEIAVLRAPPRTALPPLVPGATVLVAAPAPALPAELVRRAAAGELELLEVELPADAGLAGERWLGALVGTLLRRGVLSASEARVRARRESALEALPEGERAARLAEFMAGLAAPRPVTAPTAAPESEQPPLALRGAAPGSAAGEAGGAAAFWDRIGLPLREGRGAGLGLDPLLAAAVEPACSAPLALAAERLPAFDAARCTACGRCWSLCPHDAIAVRALTPAVLLEQALERAARAGHAVEPFRRFVGRAATRWARALGELPALPATVLLERTVADVLDDAGLDPERRAPVAAAAAAVGAALDGLPFAATGPLFVAPEGAQRGAGELLALALDPERCTGCDLCVAVCEPAALTTAAADPVRRAAGAAAARVIAELPPTAAASVASARGEDRLGPLAGALLAGAQTPTAGADAAPAGSPARLAVRQALALLAFHLAPRGTAATAEVAALATEVAAAVRDELARALPAGDLDALASGLDRMADGEHGFAALAEQIAAAVEPAAVDVAHLRRLVELARELGELSGARAPFLLVVGGGAALEWARRFPDNPFAVPTTVAAEAPLALAQGLAAAAAERALGEARLLRRARLELERPAEARTAAETLARLSWRDLEPGERARATPVVVLIDEEAPAPELERAWALLAGELSVAVVTVASRAGAAPAWAALGYAATGGVVAHATIAEAAPLDAGARGFAAGNGAALLRVLAPARAAEDEVLKSWSRARGAVGAREFPLGCRVAAVHPATAAPRADVVAEAAASERRHAGELAELAARHAAELARLESELRGRLAERARERLAELAARRRTQPGAREAS